MADTAETREILPDGSCVWVRPIRPSDVELERQFIEALSPEARRYRFLCSMSSPSDALLKQLTEIDDRRDAALIAVTGDAARPREVGAARFCGTPDGRAEVAVAVSDDWRLRGLGTLLMQRLIDVARIRGIRALFSVDSASNDVMHRFARSLGFERTADPADPTQVVHTLELQPSRVSS